MSTAYWREKALDDMTRAEWEGLCDGCAKCCLEKLEDPDTGDITHTCVACGLLDLETCRCSNYTERHRYMPDCVPLDPSNVGELKWMPSTCAYRLLAEGKDLPDWHPLITGDPESVVRAGVSVKGRVVSVHDVVDIEDHLADWPR